jgi:hypothetical protein
MIKSKCKLTRDAQIPGRHRSHPGQRSRQSPRTSQSRNRRRAARTMIHTARQAVSAIAGGIAYTSLFPTPALAEVMDKEPSPTDIWAFTVVFLIFQLLLVRRGRWLPLVIWPITAAVAGSFLWDELLDPYVGPAIRIEAGWKYVILSYTAIGINIAMPVAIVIFGRVSQPLNAK